MRHQTFSFTVQLSPSGVLDLHSWQATYAANGRQLPTARVSVADIDPGDLGYEMTEFLDAVLLAQQRYLEAREAPLPL